MRALFLVGLFASAAAFLFGACQEGEGSSPTPSPSAEDGRVAPADGLPMDFETIDVGHYSGIGGQGPQVLKIVTQAQWEEFWSRHQAKVMPAPPLPAVDFSLRMVIAAVDQQESSGGYRLEITGIEEADGGLLVRVTKEKPGQDCIVTAAISQPYHIVQTARSDLEPQLAISEETRSCG